MAAYHEELLEAAKRLHARRNGQKGKLPAARVRRSISTSYYALFHFLLAEVGAKIVGSSGALLRRRRMMARTISHRGLRTTLDKVRGAYVDPSLADFLRLTGVSGPVPAPRFARNLASAFADAQAKRTDADYDLNKPLSERDARLLAGRVKRVIEAWQDATTANDRDFKHALCLLVLLKGQLRSEN